MLEDLLRLQELDTAADQLRHRSETLPERAELVGLRQALRSHQEVGGELQARRDDVARAQRRLEDEVAGVEAKAVEEDRRLYSGTVTSPRELQAIQQEVDALHRHQRSLEDEVLVLMEQAEPLDEELAANAAARAGVEADLVRVGEALAAAEAVVAGELDQLEARRREVVPAVEPSLLERYEAMRRQLDGVAVARLVGATCGGCHLALSAAEVDRIRREPPDALVTCEECGRLLVR